MILEKRKNLAPLLAYASPVRYTPAFYPIIGCFLLR